MHIKRSGSPLCFEIDVTHPRSHKFHQNHLAKRKYKKPYQSTVINTTLRAEQYICKSKLHEQASVKTRPKISNQLSVNIGIK